MRLLLDTHVFIWATAAPGRLPAPVHVALTTPDNTILVSAATIWEIAIKRALGRLEFPLEELAAIMTRAGFDPLPIEFGHARAAGALPRHHTDPFDRMLVAQARAEGLTLVSDDAAIAAYDVVLFGRAMPL